MSTLISIIIPTYNRAHLIGETLDSVLAQTYTHWECIVVDDDSKDYTEELLNFYSKLDYRIIFYKRPKHRKKGANACRNFGFEKSKGDYIIWFDSDDIMLPRKLYIQLDYLLENKFNFSIAKFDNLLNNSVSKEQAFDKNLNFEINGENYTLMNIFWGTIDALIARDLIANTRFNEDLKSGQEYNFFTKLLLSPKANGVFINEALSLRRLHKNSIQNLQKADQSDYLKNKLEIFFNTFAEIKDLASKRVIIYHLKNCQSFSFRLAQKKNEIPQFINLTKYLYKELGSIKTLYFIGSVVSAYLTGKGFKLLKLSYPKYQ